MRVKNETSADFSDTSFSFGIFQKKAHNSSWSFLLCLYLVSFLLVGLGDRFDQGSQDFLVVIPCLNYPDATLHIHSRFSVVQEGSESDPLSFFNEPFVTNNCGTGRNWAYCRSQGWWMVPCVAIIDKTVPSVWSFSGSVGAVGLSHHWGPFGFLPLGHICINLRIAFQPLTYNSLMPGNGKAESCHFELQSLCIHNA